MLRATTAPLAVTMALLAGCDAEGMLPGDAGPAADAGPGSDARPADAGPAGDASGGDAPPSFTLVVLPDTQFYALDHPEIFQAQTRWIRDKAQELGIAFVLHEGDIVDYAEDRGQWQRASDAFRLLDGQVPYVLSAGNHDLLTVPGTGLTFAAPLMNAFFPVSRFSDRPGWGGTFEPDQIQNSHQLLRAGGRDFLVLSLEFGPRDAVLAWASDVLTRFAATPAILVTHAYMYIDEQRYDRNLPGGCSGRQCFGPHGYGLPEPVNDGEEMWQELVSRHDNLQFVLSGHMTGNAASRRRSVRPSGSHVHEILANYQTCGVYDPAQPQICIDPETGQPTKGGDGYLRIMRFQSDDHLVDVRTYSPFLDREKTGPNNKFVLDLER